MSLLIWLLVVVCIAGIVYWVLNQIPLPPPFRIVIYVVFAIIAIYFLLQLPGLLGDGGAGFGPHRLS